MSIADQIERLVKLARHYIERGGGTAADACAAESYGLELAADVRRLQTDASDLRGLAGVRVVRCRCGRLRGSGYVCDYCEHPEET